MKFGSVARLVSGVLLCSGLALAEYQLDFTIPAFAGGTISYAGGTNPLVGSNIAISALDGINAQDTDITLACSGCTLNFTTGNLTSTSSGAYDFSGGAFTVTGSVAGTSGVLMSGTFDTTAVSANFGWNVQTSFFTSDVNQAITSFYGIPATPPLYGGAFGIVFLADGGPNGSFASSQIMSGNVAAAVPEPASMVLLGTVLLAFVAIARRRLV